MASLISVYRLLTTKSIRKLAHCGKQRILTFAPYGRGEVKICFDNHNLLHSVVSFAVVQQYNFVSKGQQGCVVLPLANKKNNTTKT